MADALIVYVIATSPNGAREIAVDPASTWNFGDDASAAAKAARSHRDAVQAYAVPLMPGEPAEVPYCGGCGRKKPEDGEDCSSLCPSEICQCAERTAEARAAERGLE